MSDKKRDRDERHGQRQGPVQPADEELATWLHRFWHREEFPKRLEVWQIFGKNGDVRGHQIHLVDFKPNDKLDAERVTVLCNEIISAAQHDTNSQPKPRPMMYQIEVYDPHRGAVPVIRRLGPIVSNRTFLQQAGKPMMGRAGGAGGGDDDDDDESPLTGRNVTLRYVDLSFKQIQWQQEQLFLALGQYIHELRDDKVQYRAWLNEQQQMQIATFKAMQDAEDRKTERDIRMSLAKFKVDLMQEGVRTARNLLPGLFVRREAAPPPENVVATVEGGAMPGTQPQRTVPRWSPEKVLVDDFLHDCEKQGIETKLFGEWEVNDQGKMYPIADKPGIFRPEQCAILFGVRSGDLPPEALDIILPGSNDPRAITNEQATKAGEILPQSMQHAIFEMIGLRQRAKQAAASPAAPPSEG